MQLWHNEIGTTVFNPPREILRNVEALKELKKTGFKLKCIVNEACYYGCPQNINHAHYIAAQGIGHAYYCDRNEWKLSDILRTNFILPRHLKYYDEYVDIYKLSGRGQSTAMIAKIIDAYVNERDDVTLNDILTTRRLFVLERLRNKYNIQLTAKSIPDKLLTCQCLDCDNGCNICDKVIEKILKKANVTEQDIKHLYTKTNSE